MSNRMNFLRMLMLSWLSILCCARSEGAPVANFTLKDPHGREYALDDFRDKQAVVIVFLGVECPLAKLYGSRLEGLQAAYAAQGVAFLGIVANTQDSIAEMAAYAARHNITFPLLKDVGNRLADALDADRTPEAFLLDRAREVVYRGRIDDQYGVGYVRPAPEQQLLRAALDELLAGKPISIGQSTAVGCRIGRARIPQADSDVTYSNEIARIFQQHCVECHREGDIGPFALDKYEEAAGWAAMIEEVVDQGRMPPWHADAAPGRFTNERTLTDAEKQLIRRWVAAGAPQGDPAQLPASRTWTTGWQLPRDPDYVANITPEPFAVPSTGPIEYQYFIVDPGFTEEKWVSAVEIQPGNRAVVHHVLMFAGAGRDALRRFRGGATGFDAGYVPGQRATSYPEGMARRIDAGAKLIFQVHYTPNGSDQTDQSRVGMVFADPTTVRQEVRTSAAVGENLAIPPRADNHRVEATSEPLPQDALLIGMSPHMHLRGKSFTFEAVFPDGRREFLVDVPRYDFNWQTQYLLANRIELPKGSQVHCVAHFDNSTANLNNPDPDQTVGWGEQTWDEMMIGYFEYVVPRGALVEGERFARGDRVERLFRRLDANNNGRVEWGETPKKYQEMFERLDVDKDQELTMQELTGILLLDR